MGRVASFVRSPSLERASGGRTATEEVVEPDANDHAKKKSPASPAAKLRRALSLERPSSRSPQSFPPMNAEHQPRVGQHGTPEGSDEGMPHAVNVPQAQASGSPSAARQLKARTTSFLRGTPQRSAALLASSKGEGLSANAEEEVKEEGVKMSVKMSVKEGEVKGEGQAPSKASPASTSPLKRLRARAQSFVRMPSTSHAKVAHCTSPPSPPRATRGASGPEAGPGGESCVLGDVTPPLSPGAVKMVEVERALPANGGTNGVPLAGDSSPARPLQTRAAPDTAEGLDPHLVDGRGGDGYAEIEPEDPEEEGSHEPHDAVREACA